MFKNLFTNYKFLISKYSILISFTLTILTLIILLSNPDKVKRNVYALIGTPSHELDEELVPLGLTLQAIEKNVNKVFIDKMRDGDHFQFTLITVNGESTYMIRMNRKELIIINKEIEKALVVKK